MGNTQPLFAVIDVETTGGKPMNSKITEIAIIITDGNKIIDEYTTLVNPMKPIDRFVVKLTGISDAMVSKAPLFSELMPKIKEMIQDKIIVAHNVDFDYQMLQREFIEVGDYLNNQKLCTVKASKKVFKDITSFNLGNICSNLGIELTNAHRAYDDTLATTHLLHKVLEIYNYEFLKEEMNRQNHVIELPKHWKGIDLNEIQPFNVLYTCLNADKNPIFIDHSDNFQKKLFKILESYKNNEPKYKKIVEETVYLEYENMDLPLKAELKGLNLIQIHKPKFNKPFKSFTEKYTMYLEKDELGMYFLKISETSTFTNFPEGPYISSASFRNTEKIKIRILMNQELKALLFTKKHIQKEDKQHIEQKVKEYNIKFTKSFVEFCCPFKEGYYIFKSHEGKVEAIYVKNYYIHSWGTGELINNSIVDFNADFIFDTNQKITRKFLNILGSYSHKTIIITPHEY